LTKIVPTEIEMCHANGRTDRQKDATKLWGAFRMRTLPTANKWNTN